MHFRIIQPADFKTTRWSGGQTTELFIYPAGADFQLRDFSFRISSATVELEETTFTSLPGFSRILMVLEGEMKLVHEGRREALLKPLDSDAFEGAWITRSFGKVKDFNLIMGPAYGGSMEVVDAACLQAVQPVADFHCLYVLEGQLEYAGQPVTQGALLVVDGEMQSIKAAEDVLCIRLSISEKYPVTKSGSGDHAQIMAVWEASVRATHDFLDETDIIFYKTLIAEQFLDVVELYTVKDSKGFVLGFLGVSDDNIEMLFVHPDAHGTGIGKKLLLFAIRELGMRKVDVNEQNPAALSFYTHFGFRTITRSDTDSLGRPYPILHLELR